MNDNNGYVWGLWTSLIISNLIYLMLDNWIVLALGLLFSVFFLTKAIQFNNKKRQ